MDILEERLKKKSRGLLKVACSHSLNRIRQAHFAKWAVCEVDTEHIANIFESQGGLCFVTGKELCLQAGMPTSISVLRLDVKGTYNPSNVVVVIPFVRDAVEAFGWDEFRRMCGRATQERI